LAQAANSFGRRLEWGAWLELPVGQVAAVVLAAKGMPCVVRMYSNTTDSAWEGDLLYKNRLPEWWTFAWYCAKHS